MVGGVSRAVGHYLKNGFISLITSAKQTDSNYLEGAAVAIRSSVFPDAGNKACKTSYSVVELRVCGEESERAVIAVKVLVYRCDTFICSVTFSNLSKNRPCLRVKVNATFGFLVASDLLDRKSVV